MWIIDTINYVDTILKVVGWSTVLFSFGAIVYVHYKFMIVIYRFLKKLGMTYVKAIQISILCRKDRGNNVRLFIEYSIFATKGQFMTAIEWNQIILDFKAKYLNDIRREYIIKLENTFILRDENVKNRLEEYFAFFKEEKNCKTFSIDTSTYLSFIAMLYVEEGYIVPLVQLSSLQERYNSDWSKILNQYVNMFNAVEQRLPSEVSSFYTWLMWGPSVYVDGKENEYKLCLYGLGDEAMALPLVLSNSAENNCLWKKMQLNSVSNELGLFISGEFKLCDPKSYFKENYNHFGETTIHFVEGLINNATGGILEEVSYEINQRMEDREYIFSAYIWIMLCYDIEGESENGFDSRRTTVWFEHANISDSGNVELLTKTLVQKVITYLEKIWEKEVFEKRIYKIPWAVNETIKIALEKEIMKIRENENHPYHNEFKNRVDLDAPKLFRDSILNGLDDEFNDEMLSINYVNINFEKPEELGLLGRFYCELYVKEFPDENERESLDNIIRQEKRIRKLEECRYHCIIATKGNDIVGGIIGDYFKRSNSGVIEFVVVSNEIRNQGLGSGLISNLVNLFNVDAKELNKSTTADYYFFEVENPAKMKSEFEKKNCQSRLQFWNKMAAKIVDMEYIQPPLEVGKEAVDYLFLAIRVLNEKLFEKPISKVFVTSFLEEFFFHSFGIENIEQCNEYIQMKKNLREETIEIKRISTDIIK